MSEKFYRLVVLILAVLGASSMLGYVLLAAMARDSADALLNLAFAAVGALGGTLTQPKASEVTTSTSLEQLAAKTIVEELMKHDRPPPHIGA